MPRLVLSDFRRSARPDRPSRTSALRARASRAVDRNLAPRVRIGDRSPDEGPCDVRKEDELTDPQDDAPTVSSQFTSTWTAGNRTRDAASLEPRSAREEHEVHSDQREGEMPAGEAFEYIRRDIRGKNQK